jgi:hypothetical protein
MQAPAYKYPRYITAIVSVVALSIGVTVLAQNQPSPQPSAAVDQTLARQYLTDARNALSDITELPAAVQLSGEPRVRVQQLITNFNELITKTTDWRESYDKVEASLALLLAEGEPTAGTPGAVGTAGTTTSLDPTIRAKLVEFGTHLEQFKSVASGEATTEPASEPQSANEPPVTTEPEATPETATPDEERPENQPVDPGVAAAAEIAGVSRDIALHVEAIEAILGAQGAAQQEAVAAAGGQVVTSPTPSGSTQTTITSPNVTLTPSQLDEIKTHLTEIRRLVEGRQ